MSNVFNNLKVYEEMDNFYFSIDDKSKIEQFLRYTHNPVEMFEKRVNDMKASYIDKVLQTKAI